MLRVTARDNPFYRERLQAADLSESVSSLEEFQRRMPFTTKAHLVTDQAAHPPYGTNRPYPLEQYTRFCQTSGTSSAPLSILDTPESWEWMLNNWRVIYEAAQVAAGDRIYFAFSFGPFLGFWTAFEAAARHGCLCLPGGGLSSGARLAALLRHRAQVLCCTPTYALHLAKAARVEGIDLRGCAIRKIIVAGEPGGSVPAVRERIAEAWLGAEVLDHYGLTEVGPAAFQRLGEPDLLHVIESAYFAEIIDAQTGAAVPEGEQGELVLTTLGRTACPLLRYRTGDLVWRAMGVAGFALQGGVLGRIDDMIVVRGVNLYPSALEAVVRTVPEIAEYRVLVAQGGTLGEVTLEIEAPAPAAAQLERALAAAFSLRLPVRCVPEGSLPRSEMKARRWIVKSA